jgi:hypothetical protein
VAFAYANNSSVGMKDNNVPFLFFSSRPKSATEQQSSSISTSNSQSILQSLSPSQSQSTIQSSSQSSLTDSPYANRRRYRLVNYQRHHHFSKSSFRISPWFPSVPASACNGIFEFTIGGTAHLNDQYFKNANYNITLQITSTNGDSIAEKFWIEKKGIMTRELILTLVIYLSTANIIFDGR